MALFYSPRVSSTSLSFKNSHFLPLLWSSLQITFTFLSRICDFCATINWFMPCCCLLLIFPFLFSHPHYAPINLLILNNSLSYFLSIFLLISSLLPNQPANSLQSTFWSTHPCMCVVFSANTPPPIDPFTGTPLRVNGEGPLGQDDQSEMSIASGLFYSISHGGMVHMHMTTWHYSFKKIMTHSSSAFFLGTMVLAY